MQDRIREVLGQDGPIAGAMGAQFEPRPEQLEMALAVARNMAKQGTLLAEAGTGVGKSFAYLLPAMLRCLAGETVVIATNTIALQQQLIAKDVPLLWSMLEPEDGGAPVMPDVDQEAWLACKIRPVLVKGRGNYVSVRRLKLASQRQDKLLADPAARRSLHVIEDWAMQTQDGTLATLPPLERAGVWDKVESDSGNCMGRKCPNHEMCFYQKARRWMDKGNLLICNHAVFFSDLALRSQDGGFIPTYQHVILDEAHNVEDVASEHFGVTLSEGRVMHLLNTLFAARSNKGYLPQLAGSVIDPISTSAVSAAMTRVLSAADASQEFFESALEQLPGRTAIGTSEPGTTRLRRPGVLSDRLGAEMKQLSLALMSLKDSAKQDADKYELNAYAIRAQMIADAAGVLRDQTLPGCAYWVEATGGAGGRQTRVTVGCAPVEVAPLLRAHLFSKEFSVTLTSATLATKAGSSGKTVEQKEVAFTHTMQRLGCDGAEGTRPAETVQLGSPFDYGKQVDLIVDLRPEHRFVPRRSAGESFEGSMEDPAAASPRPQGLGLAESILEHLKATDGGAFVLFTSFASLNTVARALRGPLEDLGMPMVAQGQDGSREEILRRFREDRRSVLLGAASFWQGVDVRGENLRNVIIVKLPFEPPDRPLTEARGELIQSRGGNPFMEDALPRAIIRFKQGFGRLIRSREDRGRVVVLDPRVVKARYGRMFLSALPEGLSARVVE